ncbi:MAG: hypothetical protein JWN04_4216 [Myxococcaceae bacterium]|nr:hypothetical protein [Myxococcaceae bacterium]
MWRDARAGLAPLMWCAVLAMLARGCVGCAVGGADSVDRRVRSGDLTLAP